MRSGRTASALELFAALALILCLSAMPLPAQQQTSWCGGPDPGDVTTEWTDRFDAAGGVSWLAIPGQLALSSRPLALPETQGLTGDQYWGAESVFVADLDGDGDNDLVGASYGGDVSWWRNDGGSPIEWTRRQIDSSFDGANQIHVADLDGDGLPDVIGAAYLASDVVWWRNSGGPVIGWQRHTIDADFGGACSVWVADLDGDGDGDVMSTGFDAGAVAVWENLQGPSGPVFERRFSDNDAPRAHEVVTGDIDGDGRPDMVVAGWQGPTVSWYRNQSGGLAGWMRHTIAGDFAGGSSVDIADVDSDGDLDIVAAAQDRDEIAWWSNDGGEPVTWSKHVIASDRRGAWSVVAVDVDGDGDHDVAAAVWRDGEIVWWESDGGSVPSWTEHLLGDTYWGASAVHSGDTDGDGDLELVSAAYDRGEISVWTPTEFVESGELTSQILDTGTGLSFRAGRWSASVPDGATLVVEARAADRIEDLGQWTPLVYGARAVEIERRRYLQYRIRLSTETPSLSPMVDEVSLEAMGMRRPVRRRAP
jgi:hypothetical protein